MPPAAFAVRHRGVVLLDARDDLFVQLVLHRLQRPQQGVRVRVLRLQVAQHVRVLALVVAQPVVLVLALAPCGAFTTCGFFCGVGRGGRFEARLGHGEGDEEECADFGRASVRGVPVIC
jgi:hypothetical protein